MPHLPRTGASTCLSLASPARQHALLLKHDLSSILSPTAHHDRSPYASCAYLPCWSPAHSNSNNKFQTYPYQSHRYLATTPRPAAGRLSPLRGRGKGRRTGKIEPPPRGFRGRIESADEVKAEKEYTPATSGAGLEWVGGLKGWWDKGSRYGKHRFVGFAPRHKPAWDKQPQLGPDSQALAVLEALTRRAVVEALAWRRGTTAKGWKKADEQPKALWETRGNSGPALAVKLQVDPKDGSCKFVGPEWERVWRNLNTKRPETETIPPFTWTKIKPSDARSLVRSWADGWKMISLQDPVLRFAVAKRVQRLTGQMVPDAALLGIETVGALVGHLTKTTKTRKVVDFIKQQPALPSMANVSVYRRRVTPVDKEKMAGRWKLIKSTLEQRELPVLGTKGYGPFVETKWIPGPGPTQTAKQVRT